MRKAMNKGGEVILHKAIVYRHKSPSQKRSVEMPRETNALLVPKLVASTVRTTFCHDKLNLN